LSFASFTPHTIGARAEFTCAGSGDRLRDILPGGASPALERSNGAPYMAAR